MQVNDVMSACFVSADTLASGTLEGDILIWDMAGRKAGVGSVIQVSSHTLGRILDFGRLW